MLEHKKYLEQVENKILQEGLLSSQLIDFYKSIYDYQGKYYNIYSMKPFSPSISFPELPAIDVNNVTFIAEMRSLLMEGVSPLLSIISSYHNRMNFDYFLNNLSTNISMVGDCIRALLKRDNRGLNRFAGDNQIGFNEFIFILINWFKPLFVYLMDENRVKIDNDNWFESNCPFCGYLPDMAMIVESMDGKRYLHCALCEYKWQFKRISCTICENIGIDSLGYFVTDKEEPYRIDYCEKCKGYIKGIRIPQNRDPDTFDLTVENLITAYLDSSAIKRGYLMP